MDGKWVTSYTHQWNFTVERELFKDTRLRTAYVGTQSAHLKNEYDQNAPIYNPNLTLAQNRATIDERRPIQGLFTDRQVLSRAQLVVQLAPGFARQTL